MHQLCGLCIFMLLPERSLFSSLPLFAQRPGLLTVPENCLRGLQSYRSCVRYPCSFRLNPFQSLHGRILDESIVHRGPVLRGKRGQQFTFCKAPCFGFNIAVRFPDSLNCLETTGSFQFPELSDVSFETEVSQDPV